MSPAPSRVTVIPVEGVGLVQPGQDLATLFIEALERRGTRVEDNDILVITSKVVSKAEGRTVMLSGVVPGRRARSIARVAGRDPRLCQLVLDHSIYFWGLIPTGPKCIEWSRKLPQAFPIGAVAAEELLAREPMMLLAEMKFGMVATDAGIDSSNVEGLDRVILLPEDPSASCGGIRDAIKLRTGRSVAVIISDTDLRYNRFGSMDLAIGAWGLPTIATTFGRADLTGRPKIGGMDALTDQVASCASLVIGNTSEGIPAAIVRGVGYEPVDAPMSVIQESPASFGKGVLFNMRCRMRIRLHSLADLLGLYR